MASHATVADRSRLPACGMSDRDAFWSNVITVSAAQIGYLLPVQAR